MGGGGLGFVPCGSELETEAEMVRPDAPWRRHRTILPACVSEYRLSTADSDA